MYSLPIKRWLHDAHLDVFQDTGHRILHLISDERFWLFAMVVTLLALLIAFMLLGMFMGGSGGETRSVYPILYYP